MLREKHLTLVLLVEFSWENDQKKDGLRLNEAASLQSTFDTWLTDSFGSWRLPGNLESYKSPVIHTSTTGTSYQSKGQ